MTTYRCSANSRVLTGVRLQAALRTTITSIRFLDCDSRLVRMLPVDEAIALILSGKVMAIGRKRRVRYLQAIDPSALTIHYFRPKTHTAAADEWEDCFRTTRAAMLPPSIEWLREMYPLGRLSRVAA